MTAVQLLVVAKECLPGRVKTRLTPPLTPAGAARVAAAALADTLAAVAGTPAARRVLVLDGAPGPFVPPGFAVQPQRPYAGCAGLDGRLAAAFADAADACPLPLLLVGMDTPQVTPALLAAAARTLLEPGTDAVLGTAADGGWWALGLRHPDPELLLGVPMSTDRTGAAQRERLDAAGLRTADLPVLRDVDTADDARAVAALAPHGRFAAAVRAALPDRVPARSVA